MKMLIEKEKNKYCIFFVGEINSETGNIILEYPDEEDESFNLIEHLIQFHSEEEDSLCAGLEKIMTFVLNEGIKMGMKEKDEPGWWEKNIHPDNKGGDQKKEKRRKRIIDLFKKADPDKVTARESRQLESKIMSEVEKFRSKYYQFPIPKDECNDPNFADVDCYEYNYCALCGRGSDR